jgi:hypothetical protein
MWVLAAPKKKISSPECDRHSIRMRSISKRLLDPHALFRAVIGFSISKRLLDQQTLCGSRLQP